MTTQATAMIDRLMDAVATGKLSLETLMENMATARIHAERTGAGQGAMSAADVIEIAQGIRHHYLTTGQWTKDCLFADEWAIVRAQQASAAPHPVEVPTQAWHCRICRADLVSTQVLSGLCAACEDPQGDETMTTPTICATHPLRSGALAIVQTQQAYHVIRVDAEGQPSRMDAAEFWTFEAAYSRMSFEAGRLETREPVGSHVGIVTNSEWRMARER